MRMLGEPDVVELVVQELGTGPARSPRACSPRASGSSKKVTAALKPIYTAPNDETAQKAEAFWVSFRVSARRIGGSPEKFSPELRDRAVRMVYDRQARAQSRSGPSPRSSVSARRPCGSGATATAPAP